MYYKGIRKKEGLKLYILPETSTMIKMQNANTRKLAEQIKAQRILDIQNGGLVDWDSVKRSHITLKEWLVKFSQGDAEASESCKRTRRNALARVEEYLNSILKPDLELKAVDKEFCRGYIAYLKTCKFNNGKKTLSNTTCRMYMTIVAAALTKAVNEGIIELNPFKQLEKKEKPKRDESSREFLTIEELKLLMATPCRREIVKHAFLFSCFTGLRYCDIKSLLWSEIHTAVDGKTRYLEHKQVKTKKVVTVPLSEEALKWMPKKQKDKEKVFHQLYITPTSVEALLDEWVKAAGIQKHITYHCSRHTAATILLTWGADL